MKYVTESLADALYKARVARRNNLINESEEVKTIAQPDEPTEVDDKELAKISESEVEIEDDDTAEDATKSADEEEVDNDLDIEESDDEEESEDEVDEARWVTMHGNHALVDDNGGILKGGDPKKRVKADKKTIDAAVKDANSKSKSEKKI